MSNRDHNGLDDNTCPACGSAKADSTWNFAINSNLDPDMRVVWCSDCGFGWRNPYPSLEELTCLYKNLPLYEIRRKDEGGGGFPVRLRRLSHLIPQKGLLLDVGSGPGHFLKMASDAGWDVEGIEPRKEAAAFCREHFGIKIHTGNFEDFEFGLRKYDAITFWDVLEHVSSHDRFLQQAVNVLAPDGIIVIAIPNASGLPARIFKGRWRYTMRTHINYFKRPYLERLLSKMNLRIEQEYHTFKIHSIIQGLCSLLPYKINMNNIFTFGCPDYETIGAQRRAEPQTKKGNPHYRVLLNLRKVAFKINMCPVPFRIGDMVDLYCKKKS